MPRAEVSPAVPLAGEGEHRVRARPHFAIDTLREVHAKEREARIGNRVDEATNERPGIGRQRVVVAAERDDPFAAGVAGHRRKPIGLQTGTRDDVARHDLALRGRQHLLGATFGDAVTARDVWMTPPRARTSSAIARATRR